MDEQRLMIREIGVIVPSNVGDAVLALPAIAEFTARFPKARVTIAGGPRARAVFEGDPRISVFVEYGADEHTWRDTLSAIRRLRRQRFDLLLDLRHTLLPWCLRARWRTQPLIQPPAHLTHRRDRYRWQLEQLLRTLGTLAPLHLTPEGVWVCTAQERETVEHLWERWEVRELELVIAVSPGARSDGKRWPAERFAAVCDRLISELHADVILTGEASEQPIIAAVQRAMRETAHSAVGETTIRTLAQLLTRCDAILTNDSATLHVASSVNVPTVALFGPTDPAKYGPRSDRSVVIQRGATADIAVDDAFHAVTQLLHADAAQTI